MSPHVPHQTDLDRVLGEWFAEGPRRSPEAPMTAAIEFARSHPRRRDPLAFLRPDPMGSRSFFAPMLQPAWAAAVVGMLLIAVIAVGVGSQPQVPVATATPSPTASPSPTPSPTPTPAPTAQVIQLDVTAGQPASVELLDRSGTVTAARSGTPSDGASVTEGELEVTQVDPTTLQLRWTGLPCRSVYGLTVEAGPRMTLALTPCSGDTFPMDRVLILEFASPVDAADVETTVTGTLTPAG